VQTTSFLQLSIMQPLQTILQFAYFLMEQIYNVNQTPLHKCFVLSFFYTGIDLSNNSEMSTANNKIITSFTKLKNVQRKICTRT